MINDYKELIKLDAENLIVESEWSAKFDYKYNLSPIIVDNSRIGNEASDYFHQIERWKCDATGYPSPQKTWENERFRLTLFKAIFSLNVKELNPTIFRNLIILRKYIASQFRPSAAKAIYDYFKAENVLDLSMGWGDRLCGASASKYVKKYVGIDPNMSLFNGYGEQTKSYSKLNPNKKVYKLWYGCAEDDKLSLYEEFDVIFTSPPYYDKEKYDQSSMQSYVMYKKFDDWMNNFLYKAIDIRTPNLKVGGHLIINISDIYTRKKHYQICDLMNDHIAARGDYEYVGCWGLKMPKRPKSKSSNNVGIYGEPIWLWKKIK
jgi:16S rRNA G966 N2-methylase RsmD